MMHILEITKAREYDAGTARVVAKNTAGEASRSSTVVVTRKVDLRSHLKQAPKCENCLLSKSEVLKPFFNGDPLSQKDRDLATQDEITFKCTLFFTAAT